MTQSPTMERIKMFSPIFIGSFEDMNKKTENKAITENKTVKNPIAVMKRCEMKYILSKDQLAFLKSGLNGHMKVDEFGKTSIASLYYDTPEKLLISRSVETPDFKEKIRLRSYGLACGDSPVFLELKRKAYSTVYKRRVKTTMSDVKEFFAGNDSILGDGQINREITYFRDNYNTLEPSCLIIYDRTAYFEPESNLRLTIDENPRYRTDNLRLDYSMQGMPLLENGESILEIKVQDAIPLWLAKILSDGKIYKTSFSKYGEAYRREMIKSVIVA